MQINQVSAFLAVAELGSFSLAAERLHITQPAVSKRIRQLESSVRVALFDRIGKRSFLTPAGRAFKPHAERILQELKSYRSSLSHQQGEPSGSLSFATSHHIGLHRLPQILRTFKSRYPRVELDLQFMDSEDACAAIADNELELAIVTLPERADTKLDCEPVWIDQMVVVFAPDHALRSAPMTCWSMPQSCRRTVPSRAKSSTACWPSTGSNSTSCSKPTIWRRSRSWSRRIWAGAYCR